MIRSISLDETKAGILSDLRASFGELKCVGSERLVRLGISMTQLHVMHLLERHGEIAMSRLAEMLDVSDSAATGLIDRIEERGFVERIRVPEDRRIVLVRITPVGLQTLEDVERSRTELLGHALDQLDPSQIEGIATAMAALRVALLASHSDPISGVQHSHQPHREGLTP